MSKPFQYPVFQWVFTLAACLASGLLAYALVGSTQAPALFWPPAGVALGAVMLWGWRMVTAAALGTALAASAQDGMLPAPALWLGLAIAVQAVLGRLLLARAGLTLAFGRVGDLFRLLLIGGLLAGLAGLPLAYQALRDVVGYWELNFVPQLLALLLSQLNGVLLFTTLMLCWRNAVCPTQRMRRLEVVLALLGLGMATLLLAHPEFLGLPAAPVRLYPLLPFLLWLALRAEVRVVALSLVWVYAVLVFNSAWGHWALVMPLAENWVRPLHGFIAVVGMSFLALAMLMGTNRRLEQLHRENALAQRNTLVREVHHRIKNNLQIVVGLLRRDAAKHPEARLALESAINQVQSIAVVHGLHGRVTQHGVMLCELLPAICGSVSNMSGVPVTMGGLREGDGLLRIQESETVALALILNELISNAVKHQNPDSDNPGALVVLTREGDAGQVHIRNTGVLPPGFDFARNEGLGTGLGLVRALMPTHGVDIELCQERTYVVAKIRIEHPVLMPRYGRQGES